MSIGLGNTANTRMFCFAKSDRSDNVADHAAAFDALYPPAGGMLASDTTDNIFATEAPPLRTITGANPRITPISPK